MPKGIKRKIPLTDDEVKIERSKIWKRYYQKNKYKLRAKNKEYKIANPEKFIKYEKERYAKDPDKYKQKSREYSKNNRDKVNQYIKTRYRTDFQYRLSCILRARLYGTIKVNKAGSAVKFLGCSIEDFKKHIESNFKEGMSWSNWSYKGWHIDHIKPLSLFDLTDENELSKACHYTNLQPMWALENHIKSNKYKI